MKKVDGMKSEFGIKNVLRKDFLGLSVWLYCFI